MAEPVIDIPAPPGTDEQIGVDDIAEGVINDWLAAKQAALGADYQADQLETVLVEPLADPVAATSGCRRSRELVYWQYLSTMWKVEEVTPEDPTADQLQVTAVVSERAQLFEFDVEDVSAFLR